MNIPEVDLNYYFRADADVIYVEDEDDFEDLCADYMYYEKVAPHTPIRFCYKQHQLGGEDIYWKSVFEIDEAGELSGISSSGRLNP